LPIHFNFMKALLLGCHLLEKLKLSYCRLFISEISSNTLKYLEFDNCHSNKETQISTPNLLYLNTNTDGCDSGISFKFMPSLIKLLEAEVMLLLRTRFFRQIFMWFGKFFYLIFFYGYTWACTIKLPPSSTTRRAWCLKDIWFNVSIP
jgi:hypothetical protein